MCSESHNFFHIFQFTHKELCNKERIMHFEEKLQSFERERITHKEKEIVH